MFADTVGVIHTSLDTVILHLLYWSEMAVCL